MTKNSPLKATGAHISIVGHITKDEIRAKLTRTDMANGFANRFLFCLVRRSKLLPYGGHFDERHDGKAGREVCRGRRVRPEGRPRHMTDEAAKAWAEAYAELSADRPGLLGAVTARAEAQVIRLSLIFALLDSKDEIDTVHLGAAMAVWAYCDQSANLIFGDSLGDPVADDILTALRRNAGGMTRTDINNLFGRHRTSDQIERGAGDAPEPGPRQASRTGRRPAGRWRLGLQREAQSDHPELSGDLQAGSPRARGARKKRSKRKKPHPYFA